MSAQTTKKEQARSIITVACQILDHSRSMAPAFAQRMFNLGDECYVLLDDATRLYCQAVSEHLGEHGKSRWTSVLPRFLYEHPEKCDEILALVERQDYCGLPSQTVRAEGAV